jgi:hypothetical protein
MTQAEYARTRGLSLTLIKKQMKSGIIPTIGNKIDPEAADRSRAENLDPLHWRRKHAPAAGYDPAVFAVLQMLLHDGPQLFADRLELTSLRVEDAATAVAHFAAMMEGIADALRREELDYRQSTPLPPAAVPSSLKRINYENLIKQAFGDKFEVCMLAEFTVGEIACKQLTQIDAAVPRRAVSLSNG